MAINNIRIVVVDGGRAGSYKARKSSKGEGEKKEDYKETPLYKLLHMKDTLKEKVQSGMSPSTIFAMNMGLQMGGQALSQTANYIIADIGRRNGDSSLQEHVGRELEIVSDVTGFIGNTLSSAATGSMFGPVGAAIGAVAGLASSAISLGFF